MSQPFEPTQYRELLRAFLQEDLGGSDITTESIIPAEQRAQGELIAKAPLVLAGIGLFAEVFRLLDGSAEAEILRQDGEELAPGDIPARLRARGRALLTGERVALNLLQRLSGVATLTRRFVQAVAGTSAQILDTRKTTPGLRELEKYAVRVGGGQNHRKDLSEAVLIKENHIRLAGGVAAALAGVETLRQRRPAPTAKARPSWIEIEVTNLEELREALAHPPDVILLDNMSPPLVRAAVAQVRFAEDAQRKRPVESAPREGFAADAQRERRHEPSFKIRVEASGGITLANVREFAEAGADWISVGALTHSAQGVDLSFEIERV
jgi:nicotinate-nucleotide pyrophosphorylase (carboxylating)